MKTILLLLVLVSISNGQNSEKTLLQMLNKAYEQKSIEGLHNFLDVWAGEYKSDEPGSLRVGLNRQIYGIYRSFFNPGAYAQVTVTKADSSIPKAYFYYVIQSKVIVYVTDTSNLLNPRIIGEMTQVPARHKFRKEIVRQFRPEIRTQGVKLLSLTEKYREILKSFLRTTFDSAGNIETVPPPNDSQFVNRVRFLADYLVLKASHWGGYLIVETQPHIDAVFIDKDYQRALVQYTINYAIGAAELKRHGNRWVVVKDSLVGVE